MLSKNQQTSSLKYPLLVGSLTLLGGASYLLYKNYYQTEVSQEQISIQNTIKILKEFKRDFYPILQQLINLSLQMQNQYKSKYSYIPESFMQKMEAHLTSENPMFTNSIQKMEDRIYSKYNITNRQNFEKFCIKLSQANPIVSSLLNEIKNAYKKALRGVEEQILLQIPSEITPEIVLQIYKANAISLLNQILQVATDYKSEHGQINIADQAFNQKLSQITLNDQDENMFKDMNIQIDEFLHPKQLYTQALRNIARMNPDFKQYIGRVEMMQQQLTRDILLSGKGYEEIKIQIGKIDEIQLVKKEPIVKEIEEEVKVIETTLVKQEEKQFNPVNDQESNFVKIGESQDQSNLKQVTDHQEQVEEQLKVHKSDEEEEKQQEDEEQNNEEQNNEEQLNKEKQDKEQLNKEKQDKEQENEEQLDEEKDNEEQLDEEKDNEEQLDEGNQDEEQLDEENQDEEKLDENKEQLEQQEQQENKSEEKSEEIQIEQPEDLKDTENQIEQLVDQNEQTEIKETLNMQNDQNQQIKNNQLFQIFFVPSTNNRSLVSQFYTLLLIPLIPDNQGFIQGIIPKYP